MYRPAPAHAVLLLAVTALACSADPDPTGPSDPPPGEVPPPVAPALTELTTTAMVVKRGGTFRFVARAI